MGTLGNIGGIEGEAGPQTRVIIERVDKKLSALEKTLSTITSNNSPSVISLSAMAKHAVTHATPAAGLGLDAGTDPIGPYPFTWTREHLFNPALGATIPLTIRAASDQTANLFEIEDPTGANYTEVDNSGLVGLNCAPTAHLTVQGVVAGPDSISGLVAWFKSSTISNIGICGDSRVLTWEDSTGNGHDLYQPTGNPCDCPGYLPTETANSKPALDVRITRRLNMASPVSFAASSAFSIALYYKPLPASVIAYLHGRASPDTVKMYVFSDTGGASGSEIFHDNGSATSIGMKATQTSSSSFHVYVATRTAAGAYKCYLDGADVTNGSPSNTAALTIDILGNDLLNGQVYVAEELFYSHDLSAGERSTVEGYLNTTFGSSGGSSSLGLTEWKLPDATLRAQFDGSGRLGVGMTPEARSNVQSTTTTEVTKIIKQFASQSVDMTQWQTSAGAISAKVDSAFFATFLGVSLSTSGVLQTAVASGASTIGFDLDDLVNRTTAAGAPQGFRFQLRRATAAQGTANTGTGNISSSGTTLTGDGAAVFTTQLCGGDQLYVGANTATVNYVVSNTSAVLVNPGFSLGDVGSATAFTYTEGARQLALCTTGSRWFFGYSPNVSDPTTAGHLLSFVEADYQSRPSDMHRIGIGAVMLHGQQHTNAGLCAGLVGGGSIVVTALVPTAAGAPISIGAYTADMLAGTIGIVSCSADGTGYSGKVAFGLRGKFAQSNGFSIAESNKDNSNIAGINGDWGMVGGLWVDYSPSQASSSFFRPAIATSIRVPIQGWCTDATVGTGTVSLDPADGTNKTLLGSGTNFLLMNPLTDSINVKGSGTKALAGVADATHCTIASAYAVAPVNAGFMYRPTAAPTAGLQCAIYGEVPAGGSPTTPGNSCFAVVPFPVRGTRRAHFEFGGGTITASIATAAVAGDVTFSGGGGSSPYNSIGLYECRAAGSLERLLTAAMDVTTTGTWQFTNAIYPTVDGGASLGTDSRGWSHLFLKDTVAAFDIKTQFTCATIGSALTLTIDMGNANRTLNLIPTSAYTPTNVTTDRSYDADVTTLDELADVVGTLVADLQAKGILG